VTAAAAPVLGWSPARTAAETDRTRDILRDRFGIDLDRDAGTEPGRP